MPQQRTNIEGYNELLCPGNLRLQNEDGISRVENSIKQQSDAFIVKLNGLNFCAVGETHIHGNH